MLSFWLCHLSRDCGQIAWYLSLISSFLIYKMSIIMICSSDCKKLSKKVPKASQRLDLQKWLNLNWWLILLPTISIIGGNRLMLINVFAGDTGRKVVRRCSFQLTLSLIIGKLWAKHYSLMNGVATLMKINDHHSW